MGKIRLCLVVAVALCIIVCTKATPVRDGEIDVTAIGKTIVIYPNNLEYTSKCKFKTGVDPRIKLLFPGGCGRAVLI